MEIKHFNKRNKLTIKKYLNKIEGIITPKTSIMQIVLNVSDACNMKCKICPRGNGYEHNENLPMFMSLDTVQLLANQLEKDCKTLLIIAGMGEPTLHPQLNEIINILHVLCPQCDISMTTNGKLLTDNIIKNKAIKKFIISTYNQELLNEYTKKYKNFENVILQPMFEGNYFKIINNRANNSYYVPEEKIPNEYSCKLPFCSLTLDLNGDILPCCMDFKRINVIGNIYKQNIYDIWENNFKNIRMTHIHKNRKENELCSQCDIHGGIESGIAIEFFNFWKDYYEKKEG